MPKPMPAPKPQPKPAPMPKPAPTAVYLDKMDDATRASFVDQALKAKLPAGFHDDITQRMILAANWNDKPEVVTSTKAEAAAKKAGAVVLYRTNNPRGSIATAKKYSDMFRTDDVFSTGGSRGQTYGGGIYFSSSLNGSKLYGRSGNSNTIGAVLNKNAKVVDMSDLRGHMGTSWLKRNPKTARKLGFYRDRFGLSKRKYDMGSYTALAMAMGYNVVVNNIGGGEKYYTVLNRGALTTSTKNYWNSKGMR